MAKMQLAPRVALTVIAGLGGCTEPVPAGKFSYQHPNTIVCPQDWELPDERFDAHLGLSMQRYHCKLTERWVRAFAWWEIWQEGTRRVVLQVPGGSVREELYLAASCGRAGCAPELRTISVCGQAGPVAQRLEYDFGHPLRRTQQQHFFQEDDVSNGSTTIVGFDEVPGVIRMDEPITLWKVCFCYDDQNADDDWATLDSWGCYLDPQVFDAAIVFRCMFTERPDKDNLAWEDLAAEEKPARTCAGAPCGPRPGPVLSPQPDP